MDGGHDGSGHDDHGRAGQPRRPDLGLLQLQSTEAGDFECKLDGGAYAVLRSARAYSGLSDGSHTFSVKATDAAGNTDATPDSRTWTVDATGPVTPSPATRPARRQRVQRQRDRDVPVQARRAPTRPARAQPYSGLSDGSHTFREGTDLRQPGAASVTWTVDATAPNTTITAAPEPEQSNSASFSFTSSEAGSTFECKLDAAAFAACGSPRRTAAWRTAATRSR